MFHKIFKGHVSTECDEIKEGTWKLMSLSTSSSIKTMKSLLLTVLVIFLFSLVNGKVKTSVVSYAINAIIEEHFTKLVATHPGNVNIVNFGEQTKEFLSLMKILVNIKSANVKFSIYVERNLNDEEYIDGYELDKSSIVFFDSVETFKESASKVLWVTNPQKRYQHLIYVPHLTTLDILETFPDGFITDQISFLMNVTENLIELVATFMFTEQACRVQQIKTINRFNRGTAKWEHSNFFPKKYENFHNCELSISKSNVLDDENGELMIMVFTTALKANLNEAQNVKNGKATDLTREQQFNQIFKSLIVANPHVFNTLTFAVSPGEPYTDLERFFMMFSIELWIAIIATLIIGILVTLSLTFVSKKIRNFIVGRDVQNPTLNLISIFLTGGQDRVPHRNFARFLFVLFVVWSLIIRTCHQSILFELMQADLRRPPIATLDELFESNLTLHDNIGFESVSITLDEDFLERMAMPSTKSVKVNSNRCYGS